MTDQNEQLRQAQGECQRAKAREAQLIQKLVQESTAKLGEVPGAEASRLMMRYSRAREVLPFYDTDAYFSEHHGRDGRLPA